MTGERFVPPVMNHPPLLRPFTLAVQLLGGMVDHVLFSNLALPAGLPATLGALQKFKAHTTTIYVKEAGAVVELRSHTMAAGALSAYELPAGPSREMLVGGYKPSELSLKNVSAVDTWVFILMLAEFDNP